MLVQTEAKGKSRKQIIRSWQHLIIRNLFLLLLGLLVKACGVVVVVVAAVAIALAVIVIVTVRNFTSWRTNAISHLTFNYTY